MRRLWTTLAILILFGVGCTGILLGSFAGHAEAAKHTNKASILFIDDAAQNPAARGEIRDLRSVIGRDAVRTNLESGASWSATGQITGSDVRMRTGPSTNSDIIGYFDYGEYVTIISRHNVNWYYVARNNGQRAYVHADYCRVVSEYHSAKGQITGTGVRMRAKPSTNSDIIGYFEDGEYVTVLDFINDYWYRVQRYDGSIGYVASKYCYIL